MLNFTAPSGPWLATKTVAAINAAIEKDQGSEYRRLLGETIHNAKDAYDPANKPFRKHLGASLIGRECARQLWYSFHWTRDVVHSGQLLRLFNRGHLEEARFMAMLRNIGCEVWSMDENGKQYRIGGHDLHFGGSLDTVLRGCPDLPDEAMLGEFKTHNDNSFTKLQGSGVRSAKFEHYVQQQVYMGSFGLQHSLYLAVNKNNDELYGEIVTFDKEQFDKFLVRAGTIIYSAEPPARISNTPGWYQCKFCDFTKVCFQGEVPAVNCRTCISGHTTAGGWLCGQSNKLLTEDEQYAACPNYKVRPM